MKPFLSSPHPRAKQMSNIGTNIQVNRELIEGKKGWFWLSFRNFNPLQVGPFGFVARWHAVAGACNRNPSFKATDI